MKHNNLPIKSIGLSISLGLITMGVQASVSPLDITPQYTRVAVTPGGTFTVPMSVKNNTGQNVSYTLSLLEGVAVSPSSASNACSINGSIVKLETGDLCNIIVNINSATVKRLNKLSRGQLDPDGSFTIQSPFSLCLSGSFGCIQSNATMTVVPVPAGTSLTSSLSTLALSVKNTSLNAALTGNPRQITIINPASGVQLMNVTYPKTLSGGVTVSNPSIGASGSCGLTASTTMNPGDTCVFTITPSSTAILNDTFSLQGVNSSNTSYTVSVGVNVLSYGSTYQSGSVFSIDDTTPTNQSVGGKVLSLENQAPLFPLGIIWASNGTYGCALGNYAPCTNYDIIPGINELSTAGPGSCNGSADGACNTQVILQYLNTHNTTTPGTPVNPAAYAAGLCSAEIDGYSDWYLPAICEMGYFLPPPIPITNNCGTQANPLLQNMASNLTPAILAKMQGPFWSSTEYSGADGTTDNAWDEYFTTNTQNHDGKEDAVGVRCVRKLTQ